MKAPRVSVPIAITAAVVAVTVVLYVVWQSLLARELLALAGGLPRLRWGLVAIGSIAVSIVITWMILQAGWLVREIRTNQRQQNFIDAVTHELHTPLASLQLYLDTLRGQNVKAAERDEFLDIMSEDLGRLRRTIDQILLAARDEPRRTLRDRVNLRALLGECVEEARERGVDPSAFRVAVPQGAVLRGDPTQLRVLFRNLIDNAVRYADGVLRVEIDARPVSARRLEVAVRDRGVGIPPALLGKLFRRFQRLSQGAGSGLGLGLHIVRNIARAHGGQVRAESDGRGTGCRFVVTLPGQVDGPSHPAG